MSIWLSRLAIERWAKTSDAGAPDAAVERDLCVALVVEGPHGQLISALTDAARDGGARIGGRLTDARALDPGLVAVTADVAGDAALLGRLAHWAARWSPLVEVDGADGLRLDVTGAAHLFDGEERLLAEVEESFARLGLTTRTAIAATAGAAWALARYSLSPREREGESDELATLTFPRLQRGAFPPAKGAETDLLAPLPIAALRLSPQATHTLNPPWPQDHRRARRGAAAVARAAVSRGRTTRSTRSIARWAARPSR